MKRIIKLFRVHFARVQISIAVSLFVSMLFFITSGCGKQNTGHEDTEVFTASFYVHVRKECGYLLHEDRGNPGHFHGWFVWAENLPQKYQEYLLPVIVTYRITKRGNHRTEEGYVETDCIHPKIHIIEIKKNNNN